MNTSVTSQIINQIKLEVELLTQASSVSETKDKITFSAVVDTIVAAIATGQFQPITDLFDEGIITDATPFFEFFKTLTDDFGAAEQAALSVFKSIEDASTVSDQVSKGPSKGFLEETKLADAINAIGFGKNPSDVINFEHTEIFEIAKQLADALVATDDVDGTASLLDDQELQFFKQLTNITGVTEAIVLTLILGRTLADSFTATDSALLASVKAASDTAAAAEILTRAIGKLLADNPAVIDAEIRAVQKAFADAAATTDTASKGLGKSFSDTVNFAAVVDVALTGIFKSFSETVTATDDVDGTASLQDDQEVAFVKNITNVAGAAEAIQLVVAFVRQFSDTATITDSHASSVGRPVSDSYLVSEAHSLRAGKALNDAGLLVDVDTLDVGKALADSPVATDAEVRGIGKLLSNTSLATDSFSQGLVKILADTVDFADAATFDLITVREFEDTVDATDDVDGTASILDDQEIAFIKFVNNTAGVADLLARVVAYTRGFSDQPAASDGHSTQTSKPFGEAPTASDLLSKTMQFNRAFANQTLLTDAEIFAFGKALEDTPFVSESLVKQVAFTRAFTDAYATSDDDILNFGKSANDTATFAESISFGELLTKADSALLADDPVFSFSGVRSDTASVSEAFAFVFAATRAFTDTAGVSEAIALTLGINPSLSDTTSIADAGSLISQGYCDFSYFADDYVGTSRTF